MNNNGGELTDEQLRKTVISVMREFLKNKKFVSKEEIYSMMQNNCSLTHLDQILSRLTNEGMIVHAHDNNHFFFV
jgi:hypothetical protein